MGQIVLVGQIILMRQTCQKMRQFYDKLGQVWIATYLSISVTKMYRSATTFIYMMKIMMTTRRTIGQTLLFIELLSLLEYL